MSAAFRLPAAIRLLRPAQWTKNAVVLAAFFFALGDPAQGVTFAVFARALAAAGLFCLASGAVYIHNDLRDLALDRAHPVKRLRPLAAGELAPGAAAALAGVLTLAALAGAAFLSPGFLAALAAYMILQVAYSLGLKRVPGLDVGLIAAGFVLRAAAGALALDVTISPWLLLCAFLLALFLALCKRWFEKCGPGGGGSAGRPVLDRYDARLLDRSILLVAAAVITAYTTYTLWPGTVAKFGTHRLVFTAPLVALGVIRYRRLVRRHALGGEPETALFTDLPLLLTVVAYGIVVLIILTGPIVTSDQ